MILNWRQHTRVSANSQGRKRPFSLSDIQVCWACRLIKGVDNPCRYRKVQHAICV
ncbi:hypothetical protein SeF6a_083 [Salmonella phage SeF6a]|nr:hypothetical protein SeF6a_083 [Salmonella phage SeF6a]